MYTTTDIDAKSQKGKEFAKVWLKIIQMKQGKALQANAYGIFQVWQEEEFEDTKGANIIRISKNNRQHNGQKKKYKKTNNDQQNIHIKLQIE